MRGPHEVMPQHSKSNDVSKLQRPFLPYIAVIPCLNIGVAIAGGQNAEPGILSTCYRNPNMNALRTRARPKNISPGAWPDAAFLGLRTCRFQVRWSCFFWQLHRRFWIGNRTEKRAFFKLI